MKQFFRKISSWKEKISAEQEEAIGELGWSILAIGIYGVMFLGFYLILKIAFA